MQQVAATIDYKALYEQAQATIALLHQRIEQLEKMVFGSKQERFVPSPAPAPLDAPAETKQITYTRTIKTTAALQEPAQHPGRNKLPDHLRREDIVLEPDNIPK